MSKLAMILMWLLVILCGGCAITEVLIDKGRIAGLLLIMTSLAIIIYIIRIPEEIKNY
jgi:hypothetical protein